MMTNLTSSKRRFPFIPTLYRLLLFLFILPVCGYAQIEAEFTTTINTNCEGSECDYDGPGILINELMVAPNTGDGSLWGGQFNQKAEWIELYNPNFCEPVDISCFYLGNAATDGTQLHPGGYVIPEGTIVPPAGFAVVRGINAAAIPAELLVENGGNTVELVVEDNANVTGQVCVGGGNRLWFPNAGGWFAFYDSFGEPQDAVRWASPPANDLASSPCVPPFAECQSANSLASYNNIPDDRKENIYTGTTVGTFQGQSFRRIPDGGAWSGAAPPTYGTCNAECVNLGTSTCNGTATVTPEGGVPPYTYLWNDAQLQTSQTAEGLCGGEYCVTITDAEDNVTEQCVIIEEPEYEVDVSANFCSNESYTLPDNTVVSEAGVFPVMFQTAGGCDSLVTIELEVLPSYSFDLNPEICANQSYTLPDSTEVTEPGTYTLNFITESGCDSVYTVILTVVPIINVSQEFEICDGESHLLPDGTEVSEGGNYEVQIEGTECDTLYLINLVVNTVYEVETEVSICAGETHLLPDGEEVDETGVYTTVLQTAAGCDSTIQTLLMVNPLPELSIPIDEAYCYLHGTVVLNPEPSGGTLSGFFVTDNILDLNFAPPGDYTISYDYTDDNGCSNSIEQSYSVLPEVTPGFDYQASCFNVANFTNLTPDPEESLSYVWLIEDEEFSTAVSPSYPYDDPGEFMVTLIATNSANCSYSYSQEVLLEEGLQLSAYQMPNIITPNNDGINDQLKLMPADDHCLNYKITIFNRWGIKVYEMTESSVPFSGRDSNGNELGDGVYFYIFESPQIDCNNILFEQLCKGSITVLR
jgi:gliding motility-associated-like protein